MSDFDFSDRTRKQIDYAKLFDTFPCVTDGYISPIQTIASQIEMSIDGAILNACQRVGVDVNKAELVKALEYDRGQYEKGFKEGYLKGYLRAAENIIKALTEAVSQEGE